MKKLLFLVLIMSTFAFTVVITGSTSVLITPSSNLVIKGKTNVSSFKCEYDIFKFKNPIPVFFQKIDNRMVFENTTLILENNCFDCGGKGINSDFQELLKSNLYPKTRLQLKEIYPDRNNENKVLALIDISLAGVTKSCKIPVTLKGDDILIIEGVLNLNICDFNLEPPKKALGLIVVKELIDINFHLEVQEH
ncbi:hypothetical protein [Algibacter sp.]|uniref:hypothetical protein n=1 Tax=Algibacter sp. TaxID=1872428 RepID=UPI003C7578E7